MTKRELFLAGPTREIPSGQGGTINSFTRICSFIHLSLFCCLIKLYTTVLLLKSIGIALFFKWLFCHIATTEIINKTGKEIKNELRESLNKLSEDKKDMVVMVYFMGYTRMVGLCYFQVNNLTLTFVAVVNQGRNQLPFFCWIE